MPENEVRRETQKPVGAEFEEAVGRLLAAECLLDALAQCAESGMQHEGAPRALWPVGDVVREAREAMSRRFDWRKNVSVGAAAEMTEKHELGGRR